MNTKYATLPIQIKYKDKIELTTKLLQIYSKVIQPLSQRNISLLVICLLENMNDKEFNEIVINSNIGITNDGQFRTEFSRLKTKGLIIKDDMSRKKYLEAGLQKIADIIKNNESKIAIYIAFDILK